MTNPGPGTRVGNIFLIGPMGAGKTTVGRALAELTGHEFVDADQQIEARTGAGIPLIFDIEGEAGFRKRESAAIEELSARHGIVLATGGGAVLAPENRERLRARGAVVYLRAPLEVLLERTARDRNRPLLQTNDRRKTLEDILRTREPLYRATAHVVVETSRRPPAAVAREILAKLETLTGHENAHA
jgi:shikimate kinase